LFALVNGTIFTMSKMGIIKEGIVLVNEGKIVGVGRKIKIPDEAEKIDVQGKIVFPGMIDAHNHIGGHAEAEDPPFDNNEWTSPVTPHVRMIDGVNPLDEGFQTAAKAGVTTIFCTPGSANVISGTAAVLKTVGKTISDMILLDPAAMKMAFGRKFPRPSSDIPYPATRMGTAAILRNTLIKTINYLKKKRKAEENPEKEPPEPNIGFEYLALVLQRKIPAHVHVSRADDIMTFARIADEFGFNWCIAHGFEAHVVAEELAKRKVPVVLGPIIYPNFHPDIDWSPEIAVILHKAGVKIALQSDGPAVFPTQHLPLLAAAVVRAGMDEWEALKAITINAAEIIGVDHRVGSIEVGKDADLVIFSDHPLKWRSKVEKVFINGKEIENLENRK